ncbi:hypothetical protein [Sporosarcina sp. G11-34]|uniref:hypothetical protein n=1 Tax=Sporosarcina sp. G11-34 TaxID=2849605 RepID=UPI0022A9C074|nr:hypothetical protein [Sporosarcina sp. G11-34]MCZ2256940.1 hypothetical protein [Sporosarcina sp. G11-34]
MRMVKLSLFLIGITLIAFACTPKTLHDDSPANVDKENNTEEVLDSGETDSNKYDDEQSLLDNPMSEFFLPSGTNAHYKGEGNEFAELDIEVTVLDESHVVVDEDNGGVSSRTIYQIQEDKISILSSEPIDFDDPMPTSDMISKMIPLEIYLQKPFEVGSSFGKWTIIETDATTETPFKTFNDVIVNEMDEDDFINRKYFAKGFGEIKREAIMITENNDDFIVTSTLQSVD